ncbi:MAG: YihY/virulence factor BrkB family protein [Actinomycetota bacterium]|nr:YihY/virulence factor BrkB family protein [Actinomycetota bacterium]
MFIDALLRRLGLLRFGPFVAKIRAEVSRDRISGLAAEVAFFGTLSIFPALLMLATALGYIGRIVGSDVVDTSRAVVVDFVSGILTEQGPVNAVESLFLGDFGGVLTLSIATAVYAMSRGFSAVITALDLAYDLPETRSWIRQRVVAVGLGLGSVLFALLMLVMFVAGPLLGGGDAVADFLGLDSGGFRVFWNWLRWPAMLFALVAWAILLYKLAPHHRMRWRRCIPGALFSAFGWLAVSLAFSAYLRVAFGANQILGAIGGGLVMMVWLYMLSWVLLVGGELNALIDERLLARLRLQ